MPFGAASAQTLLFAPMQPQAFPQGYSQGYVREQPQASDDPVASDDSVLPERLRRQIVSFDGSQPAGTIVIDTGNTVLYYVLGQGRAIRYGVGVGRDGFTWSGVQSISRKAEWPDWHPPAEMIARQPYLPRFVAGGPGNPLGARAMYLGASEYRIHGTNDPTTIGKFVSSGCIRMTNEDVVDLFNRVNIGTRVVVLSKNAPLLARDGDPLRRPARPATTIPASGRQALNVSPVSPTSATPR
ncbi:L,D-transpeptidase [Bradyrhizobium iriomotense]|uniref:L,D-transpeptidase n=2 Tax=Bradyrhizobium iriomotense TaxID=441950 RepID=A0ABQ6B0T0_9BRAD|nr:L,D-transpeptidase [Bradyrhizobium iriomotense]